jgi:hypothetical protein
MMFGYFEGEGRVLSPENTSKMRNTKQEEP